jgi:putative peptidoglycan lipid II flippase
MSEPVAPIEKSFVAHARVIGLITLVSRVLGLVREIAIARFFGASAITDAFNWAFMLPNLFRKLLGEGALSAAFIPLYAKAVRRSEEGTDQGEHHTDLAVATVSLQILILIAVTLVGEAALFGTLWLRGDLRPETRLAIKLAAVMLPYVVFVCAAALLGGILQVHRRFIATTATAVLLNVLMLVAIGAAAMTHDLNTDAGQQGAVWSIAWSVLVAGAAQVVLLFPSLAACGFRARLTTHFWTPAVRQVLKMTVPVALGLGVLQLGVLLDKQISFLCSPQRGETVSTFLGITYQLPMESGALTRLNWAQYLYQFPLGVFGIAIATAIFPQLSGQSLDDAGRKAFRDILGRGIKATMFIGLPASVGMILIALPAVRLLFERGQFTYHDSILTARSTAIYSAVIWAFCVQQILNRAYYALHDMRTPLVWAVLNLLINLVVELPLLWTPLGESAMAVGTVASFLVQTTAMTWLLARRVGLPLGGVAPELSKMLVATLAMAGVCAAVRWGVPWSDSTWGLAGMLLAVMGSGGVCYFAVCFLLGLPMESLVPPKLARRFRSGAV